MHIVIVNPFDPLPYESARQGRYAMLSNELIEKGHTVSWITADFYHKAKKYREFPVKCNINIIPCHVPSYFRNVSVRRVFSHRVYGLEVQKHLDALHRVDVVVASLPPIESARAAMKFCVRRNIPGILDVQDAWPMVLGLGLPRVIRTFPGKLALYFFEQAARDAVSKAGALVAVSPEYLAYAKTLRSGAIDSGHNAVFPLGFDTDIVHTSNLSIKKINADAPLKIVYIGNFGRFYDLSTVIYAARLLPQIEFTLIGGGPTHNSIVKLAHQLGLHNVVFTGYLPFEEAVPILVNADVGLVPITADWPPNIPNKAFDYLFLGLPIVSSVQGSFEGAMTQYNFGKKYQAGDPESLASTLQRLASDRHELGRMGRFGTLYAQKFMVGKDIYQKYSSFIEDLVR